MCTKEPGQVATYLVLRSSRQKFGSVLLSYWIKPRKQLSRSQFAAEAVAMKRLTKSADVKTHFCIVLCERLWGAKGEPNRLKKHEGRVQRL